MTIKKNLPLTEMTITPSKSKLCFNSFVHGSIPIGVYGFRPGALQVKYGSLNVNVDGTRYFLRAGSSPRLAWTEPCLISLSSEAGCEVEISFYSEPFDFNTNDVILTGNKALQQNLSSALWRVREYMIASADSHITLDNLAEHAYLSQNYLVRTFKKKYGLPPFSFLRVIRCYMALEKLVYSNMKSVDVAMDGSFCDQSHFIRAFKMTFGFTPKAMLKLCKVVEPQAIPSYQPSYIPTSHGSVVSLIS